LSRLLQKPDRRTEIGGPSTATDACSFIEVLSSAIPDRRVQTVRPACQRRKFFEAAQAGDRVAAWFVEQVTLLSAVENKAREAALGSVLHQRERAAVTSGMVLVASDVPVFA
jgi:hypothetical protein